MFGADFAHIRLLGYVSGFVTSYLLFSSGLFIVLTLTGRFPAWLGSADYMLCTATVALLCFIVRRNLE